jgi:hypothetical protein
VKDNKQSKSVEADAQDAGNKNRDRSNKELTSSLDVNNGHTQKNATSHNTNSRRWIGGFLT